MARAKAAFSAVVWERKCGLRVGLRSQAGQAACACGANVDCAAATDAQASDRRAARRLVSPLCLNVAALHTRHRGTVDEGDACLRSSAPLCACDAGLSERLGARRLMAELSQL